MSECTWHHDTVFVHFSFGNKVVLYCNVVSQLRRFPVGKKCTALTAESQPWNVLPSLMNPYRWWNFLFSLIWNMVNCQRSEVGEKKRKTHERLKRILFYFTIQNKTSSHATRQGTLVQSPQVAVPQRTDPKKRNWCARADHHWGRKRNEREKTKGGGWKWFVTLILACEEKAITTTTKTTCTFLRWTSFSSDKHMVILQTMKDVKPLNLRLVDSPVLLAGTIVYK